MSGYLSDEIYKEVAAFANTDGGVIYLGVNNQGETVGLEDESGTGLSGGVWWDGGEGPAETSEYAHPCLPGDPPDNGAGADWERRQRGFRAVSPGVRQVCLKSAKDAIELEKQRRLW